MVEPSVASSKTVVLSFLSVLFGVVVLHAIVVIVDVLVHVLVVIVVVVAVVLIVFGCFWLLLWL